MKNKYTLGTIIKFKSNPEGSTVIGEIESITETKQGVIFNVLNNGIQLTINDTGIIASYVENKVRKTRAIVKKNKKVQSVENTNEVKGE